jgi:hypothetical protein
LTNPVTSDRNLTIPTGALRSSDASRSSNQATGSDVKQGATADTADIDRAQQVLNQVSRDIGTTGVATADEARNRLEQLKALINNDPQTAAAAQAGIDGSIFDAAMARPTA